MSMCGVLSLGYGTPNNFGDEGSSLARFWLKIFGYASELKLNTFTRGWFLGKFDPSIIKTDFEVAVKEYKAGDHEKAHPL